LKKSFFFTKIEKVIEYKQIINIEINMIIFLLICLVTKIVGKMIDQSYYPSYSQIYPQESDGIYIVWQELDLNDPENQDPSIYARFNNLYEGELEYIRCDVNGGTQIEKIQNPLQSNQTQKLTFIADDQSMQVDGYCFYKIPVNHTYSVELDILFYRSFITGHEYYGLSNSEYYDVWIDVVSYGKPQYYIFNPLDIY